jgi:hypothetical protein
MWWFLFTSDPSFRKKEPSLPLGTSRDPSGDRSKPLGKLSQNELNVYFWIIFNNLKSNELLLREKVKRKIHFDDILIDLFVSKLDCKL